MKFLHQNMIDRVLHWPLSIAYTLHPKRIRHAPRFLLAAGTSLLRGGAKVPARDRVVPVDMLFGGVAREIAPETVLRANRLGFFLEAHAGPQKWWTLERRMVIVPSAVRINPRLRSQIRNSGYTFTLDREFEAVVRNCAAPRPGRLPLTWIRKDLADVYLDLFEKGYAHSFELWDEADNLVGGGYGLAIGKAFVLESMFHTGKNASKIGLVALNHHLSSLGFMLNDAKTFGELYNRLGYRLIERQEFEGLLDLHAREELDQAGRWSFGSDLAEVSDWNANATEAPRRTTEGGQSLATASAV